MRLPQQKFLLAPSLALAVSVGHHIESVLAQSIRQDNEKLLCDFLARRSMWLKGFMNYLQI